MALTNKNNTNGPLFVLKPVSKNKDKKEVEPYFEISKSGEDGKFKVEDNQSINTVSGKLFRIEAKEDEYQGDKYYRARIFLRDGEEGYMLATRLNIAARSLINCLFSLSDFDREISIKYYRSKAGYESFYVSQNGEKVGWKFEASEIPKPQEVSFRGKTIRDFTEVDAFFVEQIRILNEKLASAKSPTQDEREDYEEQEESEAETEEAEEEISENKTSSPKKKTSKNIEEEVETLPF